MITSIPEQDILKLLLHQLDNTFMLSSQEKLDISRIYPSVLEKLEYCFERTTNKYYSKQVGGLKYPYFNPFHSETHQLLCGVIRRIGCNQHGGDALDCQ